MTIELDNYVLLSPDNIPLDDKDKAKLQQVLEKDPLALIEYWSIDPDYDGITFRSQWQDYRENTDNDSDPLHCIYTATLITPRKAERTVCVKAVDVFGFESMVTETIHFLKTTHNMRNDISLELASRLTEQVKTAFENGSLLDAVTPVTQDLLKFWFMEPYTEERSKNFHKGQNKVF